MDKQKPAIALRVAPAAWRWVTNGKRWRRGLAAGLSVLLAAAIGVVTNLVTDEWSLGLGITLVVLVVCAVVIGMSTALGGGGDAQGVQQRAKASGNSAITQAGRDVHKDPERD